MFLVHVHIKKTVDSNIVLCNVNILRYVFIVFNVVVIVVVAVAGAAAAAAAAAALAAAPAAAASWSPPSSPSTPSSSWPVGASGGCGHLHCIRRPCMLERCISAAGCPASHVVVLVGSAAPAMPAAPSVLRSLLLGSSRRQSVRGQAAALLPCL